MAPKVLIIEDDHLLSAILGERFQKEGVEVFYAYDGEEGLKQVEAVKPNIVFLDLLMPKKTGMEFLETVQVDPVLSRIPVVVMSNFGQDSDIEAAKLLGAAGYFVKAKTSVEQLATTMKTFVFPLAAEQKVNQ